MKRHGIPPIRVKRGDICVQGKLRLEAWKQLRKGSK
jgi:hypothetical protein